MNLNKTEKDHRAKLLSIAFGIMGRIRESYQDELFGLSEYETGIENICKVKDSFDTMKVSEVQDSIFEIASKYGTLKVTDILSLVQLDGLVGTNEISFYDTIFKPMGFSVQKLKSKKLEIKMTDTMMINTKLIPKGIKDSMDFSLLYSLSQGCLVITTDDITLHIFGCYKVDSAEHYFKSYSNLNDKYNELVVSLKRKVDISFCREYIKYMLLRDFDLLELEDLKTYIKDEYQTLKRIVKLQEEQLIEEMGTSDVINLRKLLTLVIMRSIHSRIIPEIRHICHGHIFNLAYSSLHEQIQQKYQKAVIVQSISMFLGGQGMKRTIHDLTREGDEDDPDYDQKKGFNFKRKGRTM